MRFNIAKKELSNVLNIVLKGMAQRSTLPILAGILIDASRDNVIFQTTDLEISIKHTTQADVIEEGKTVIAGKLFSDIIKSLPDAVVNMSSQQDHTKISCENSTFTLSSLNPADFPYFPTVDATQTMTLSASDLASIVRRVGKAVSRDESQPEFMGIQLRFDTGVVHFTATDKYRLAFENMSISDQESQFEVIIPGKTFEDVVRLAEDEENITLGFSNNQVVFIFGNTIFVSRKIEGTYPDCQRLIPRTHDVTVHVNKNDLTSAIKRVSLLTAQRSPIRFAFSSQNQQLIIRTKNQDVGDAQTVVEAQVEGPDIEIAFNYQYILDGLNSIQGDAIFELQTPLKPGIIKGSDNPSFLYLVMPVRLN